MDHSAMRILPEQDVPEQEPLDFANLSFHHLATSYPLMPESELELLANSIRARGLKYKIIIWNNRIVDGRNRYVACKRFGVELTPDHFKVLECDEAELEAEIEAYNEARRHLTADWLKQKRLERIERVAKAYEAGKPLRKIAAQEGISHKRVADDLRMHQAATLEAVVAEEKANGAEPVGNGTPVLDTDGAPPGATILREPGDDTEDIQREEAREKAQPKNGAEVYKWRDFHSAVGALVREIDKIGNAYKAKESAEAVALRKQLLRFRDTAKAWYDELRKARA